MICARAFRERLFKDLPPPKGGQAQKRTRKKETRIYKLKPPVSPLKMGTGIIIFFKLCQE
ncbi:hypothetical protein A2574_00775 [Candidatus Shapirobacteria bacterium RIFOXYD1_FULL_38_32]|nr:MAG: hypothetical protein A2574_00775 [Candidatus Shapirobacteria bacterium RIFOXYD1_FULL_38_32]